MVVIPTRKGGDFVGILWNGFIVAALSEEFFRVIWQMRLGALLHNFGMGWLLTMLIWALMNTPKWYNDNHNLAEALLDSIRIIPIDLVSGYLTHSTMSILHPLLVQGTNVLGGQNF